MPVSASHTFTVRLAAAARRLPSGLNATLVTSPVWPLSVRISVPVSASHTFTVLSVAGAGDAFAVGAERHAGDLARVPLEGEDSWPVSASQTFTVWSQLAETMRLPSGLNATLMTELVCPLRVRISWPVAASQTFTVLSLLPRDDAFAVGAERHADDSVGVPLEGEDFLARVGVPDLHRLVPAAAEAMRLPSGLNATLLTSCVCPLRERTSWPVSRPRPSPSRPRCRRRCVCRRG